MEHISGVMEVERDPKAITLYPNPVGEVLTVEISSDNISRVELYDVFGKLVATLSPEGTTANIHVGYLPAGVYMVRTTLRNGSVQTGKVMKL